MQQLTHIKVYFSKVYTVYILKFQSYMWFTKKILEQGACQSLTYLRYNGE